MEKKCTKCQKTKPLDEFYREKSSPSGRRGRCKICEGKYIPVDARCRYCGKWFTKKMPTQAFCVSKCQKKYWVKIYQKSINGFLSAKRTREKNKDRRRALWVAWYKQNRDRILDYKKAYYQANKRLIAIRSSARYYEKKDGRDLYL